MTPKQKRAIDRTRAALLELSVTAIDDGEALDVALTMLLSVTGTMLGGALAVFDRTEDEATDAIVQAADLLMQEAGVAYKFVPKPPPLETKPS